MTIRKRPEAIIITNSFYAVAKPTKKINEPCVKLAKK